MYKIYRLDRGTASKLAIMSRYLHEYNDRYWYANYTDPLKSTMNFWLASRYNTLDRELFLELISKSELIYISKSNYPKFTVREYLTKKAGDI